MLAIDAVRQDEPLQFVGAEAPVEEMTERAGEKCHEPGDIRAGRAPQAREHAPQFPYAPRTARIEIGRSLQKKWLEERSETPQFTLGVKELLHVARCDPFELAAHARTVVPPGDDAAVLERSLHPGFAGDHLQAVGAEAQIANDFGPQHARDVGSGGDATAGREP